VNNLPAGVSWEANKETYPLDEGNDGCIKLCGIPLEADSFLIEVQLNAKIGFINRQTTVELNMYIAPSLSVNEGFTLVDPEGCGQVVASFENNVPSNGTEGFSYNWDFGNGNSSTEEDPLSQIYSTPGEYVVNYEAIIDTIGFILTELRVEDIGCGDLLSKPDLYINIKNPAGEYIYQTDNERNTDPPISFKPNIVIGPGQYTLEVMDEDGGLDGGDDLCTSLNFTREFSGEVSGSDWSVVFNFIHPVDTVVTTDTVRVFAIPDAPQIEVRGPLSFCAGQSALLISSYAEENLWYKDGVPLTGANTAEWEAFESGDYQVAYTSDKGCVAFSEVITIETLGLPEEPVFVNENNELKLDPSVTLPADYTLQWYFDDGIIAEATDSVLCSTETGLYRLFVTDNVTGCISSYAMNVTNDPNFDCLNQTSVAELDEADIDLRLFPNPFGESLTVSFQFSVSASLSLEIYDMLGRQLYGHEQTNAMGPQQLKINAGDWPSGIYLLKIRQDDAVLTRRVVKQ
ncbi:MAG: T9SS type A sorting domain-containing protein, partial [Bacteroidota bacterium]